MIDPSSLIPFERLNTEESSILVIKDPPVCDIKEYDLFDPKIFKKYISDLERICRNSREYKKFISYLRENLDMNKCSFMENVSNENDLGIKIEIHHSPFTLFDIVNIVYARRATYNESLEIELVAKEVMYLHYRLIVGLIPLSETIHDLVHTKYVFIPVSFVMGNYDEFFQMYKPFISPEVVDSYERILEFSTTFDTYKQNEALQKSYLYLNVEGQNNNYQYTIKLMNKTIDDIKARQSGIFINEPPRQEMYQPIHELTDEEYYSLFPDKL